MNHRSFRAMNRPVRILIVDDHPLFRTGLQKALELEENITIIGYSVDGEGAIKKTAELTPDVVVLDVNLPDINGLQVARALKADHHRAAIIILTAHHDNEQLLHAFNAGASAYCSKDVHPDKLIQIIYDTADGFFVAGDQRMDAGEFQRWLQAQIDINTGPYITDSEGHFIPLSPRELEILQSVTRGMINKEIAHKLGISQQTVKNHMTSILKKLNVNDRTQAAVIALRRGWVRMDGDTSEEG